MLNSLIATVGCSNIQDAKIAGTEAAHEALMDVDPNAHHLALVFASSCFDQPILLKAAAGVLGERCSIIGGSTCGEISPIGPITHSCVIVLLSTKSETPPWRTNALPGLNNNPRQTAALWAQKLISGIPVINRTGCLIIGDGLCAEYSEIQKGIKASMAQSTQISGYLAGDDCQFKKTFVYDRASVYASGISGCLFLTPLQIGIGVSHGFSAISKPRKITEAHNQLIDAIDKKPAVSVLIDYFGKEGLLSMHSEHLSRQSLAFPIGIQDNRSKDWTLRYINRIHRNGAVQCNSEVQRDHWMQLMVGNRAELLASAHSAAAQALEDVPNPKCILVFSSYIRKQLLGQVYAEEELESIRRMVSPKIPVAGCYSYGEINPDSLQEDSDAPLNQCGSIQVIAIGTA